MRACLVRAALLSSALLVLVLPACGGDDFDIPVITPTPGAEGSGTPLPSTSTPPAGGTPTAPEPTANPTPTPLPATPTLPPAPTPCADVDNDGTCAASDCNDLAPLAYPGATEICDSIDNDCDGTTDESDGDGDGWHSCSTSPQPGDCNDGDVNVSPGKAEQCDGIDNNCDGDVDEGFDQDFDGYPTCSVGGNPADCNDRAASVRPGATEACNGVDDDCDGTVDEGVSKTYYQDSDGDGFGSNTVSTQACSPPAGYVVQSGDCDDTSASVKPNAQEICDGKDNNCNGSTSDEFPLSTFYQDADKDTYGGTATTQACLAPAGYTNKQGDCDDTAATTYPGAQELCDGKDNDCDLQTDEGLASTYYEDNDKDTYGDPESPVTSCASCTSCVANNTDCNDGDATIYPGAPEQADGKDNNCDGEAEAELTLGAVASVYLGSMPGGRLGTSVDSPGDMDGDGYDELAMGAPKVGGNAGAVYLVYGAAGGWSKKVDSSADATLTLDRPGSFGTAVSGGDINGDGFADLVSGGPTYGALGFENGGVVFITYGGAERTTTTALTPTDPRSVYAYGYFPDVLMGTALDAHGDMNGDSYSDVLVGAPWNWISQVPPVAGIVFIIPGQGGKYQGGGGISSYQLIQIYGETNQIIGSNVTYVGDSNEDFYDDFLGVGKGKQGSVTSPINECGIVYGLRGGSSATYEPGGVPPLNASDLDFATLTGDTSGDLIGKWADGVGDVNDDGVPDFILGRQAARSGEPMAMVFFGGYASTGTAETRASISIKSSANLQCPCAVGSIGDFNGDGLGDFAVSSLNTGGGKVFLFYGRSSWGSNIVAEDEADLILVGEAGGDQAGTSLTSVGDLNGDGNFDLAIGAPGADPDGRTDAGKVYLMFGF